MKNGNILARLKFSVAGLRSVWIRERSFRTQTALTAGLFLTCLWIQPSAIWWAMIIVSVSFASSMEIVNGALEAVIDRLHPERHPAIGTAKDMASAAAFVANCATGLVFIVLLNDEFL